MEYVFLIIGIGIVLYIGIFVGSSIPKQNSPEDSVPQPWKRPGE